jgi:transcriptional regulator with XRE-family HTH domain
MLPLVGYPAEVRRFGENVKRIRKARGLTHEALARRLGLKRQANLSRLENGNAVPSPKRICAFAKALTCRTSELLDGVETDYDRLRRDEPLERRVVARSRARTKKADADPQSKHA